MQCAVPRQEPEPRPALTENGFYVIYAPSGDYRVPDDRPRCDSRDPSRRSRVRGVRRPSAAGRARAHHRPRVGDRGLSVNPGTVVADPCPLVTVSGSRRRSQTENSDRKSLDRPVVRAVSGGGRNARTAVSGAERENRHWGRRSGGGRKGRERVFCQQALCPSYPRSR
jgi:hypothetical protein